MSKIDNLSSKTTNYKNQTFDGVNYGNINLDEKVLNFHKPKSGNIFKINYDIIESCEVNKNEIQVDLKYDNAKSTQDWVTEVRFAVFKKDEKPFTPDEEYAMDFRSQIITKAKLGANECLVNISDIQFSYPRGRYNIYIYNSYIKLQGPNNDFKILNKHISAGYLLEKSDFTSFYIVLSLNKGFTLGKTEYKYISLIISNQEDKSLELNLQVNSKSRLKNIYNKLLYENIRDLFRDLTDIKFHSESSFESVNKHKKDSRLKVRSLQCTVGKDDGLLYPLDESLVFITKPVITLSFKDIQYAKFVKTNRSFTLKVRMHSETQVSFDNLNNEDLSLLHDFLQSHRVTISSKEDDEDADLEVYQTDAKLNPTLDEDEDDEDDEDFEDKGDPESSSATDEDAAELVQETAPTKKKKAE